MKTIIGRVASVYVGSIEGDLAKQPCASLTAELDGFVGDRHRSISRQTWAGDKQAEGTQRRNERHWSAVSVEELAAIEQHMDLNEPLKAADLGANLCIEGVPQLSLLAMGTILKFSSGAELMVEEYNPPCLEMSKKLASLYTSSSGGAIANNAFSKAAKYSRGLVGVVEVAGLISAGDEVTVVPYRPPAWVARLLAQQTEQ